MKFSISKNILQKKLNNVQRAVSKKTTLPVLTGIFMETTKEKGLHLIGTDLDLGIECWIADENVTIKEQGSIVLPATQIYNIVRELPPEEIYFSLNLEDMTMKIKCHNSEFKINGFDPEEFPQLPEVKRPVNITLPGKDFKRIIEEVSFSISNNQSQPSLTGALMLFKDRVMEMVSTNTYRLAHSLYTFDKNNNDNDKNDGSQNEKEIAPNKVIIPGNTLNELKRVLPDSEESEIEILLGNNHIKFCFDNFKIVSRLIEGQFPNYNQVIPEEYNTRIEANKKELQHAVKRASLIAQLDSNEINLEINEENNILLITSTGKETGEAHEELPISLEGPEQKIKIDAGYLLDVLKIIDKEKITLNLIGPVSPLTIKLKKETGSYTYLIMPIRQD